MIQSQGLQFFYAGDASLHFPDMSVAQGETLLLCGNSGSGKSTWLALACGLLSAAQGIVQVAGQDLGALQGAARDRWRGRNIGFLPQRLHLTESLSVCHNLDLVFFAAGLPVDSSKTQAALEALGVSELALRRPSELSGGQAQRVALARAVLLSPQVILVDEPTASLDDSAAVAGLSLLTQAAKRCGATLVIATHDSRVSAQLDLQGLRYQTLRLS
jgi:putative ABC transport system ATP-binding protein